MHKVMQTRFGGTNAPRDEIGNCYPACIASLLDLELADVPHFFSMYGAGTDEAQDAILGWMQGRNQTSVCHEYAPWINRHFRDSLAIIGGNSPRGDWQHAVIGLITADGWRLVHDPHPSNDGIVGTPNTAEFLLPLRRLEVA